MGLRLALAKDEVVFLQESPQGSGVLVCLNVMWCWCWGEKGGSHAPGEQKEEKETHPLEKLPSLHREKKIQFQLLLRVEEKDGDKFLQLSSLKVRTLSPKPRS